MDDETTRYPIPTIVNPGGHALDAFFEHLAQLLRGRATDHVRIGFYGDSNMTMDWFTGALRRSLQKRYGDAGHGFVAVGRPWDWYRHQDVKHGLVTAAWTSYAASTHRALGDIYGFAGIAAQSHQLGALAWMGTADEASEVGRAVSRFDIYYMKSRGYGAFEVRVDGAVQATIDTSSNDTTAAFHRIDVPDGPHKLELKTVNLSPVRLFGVVLERERPGFVVDSLGMGGAGIHVLARVDAATTVETLRRRRYDLIAFLFGTNSWDLEHQGDSMRIVAERHRQATPNIALLVMSPPDHAVRGSEWRSDPWTVRVSRLLRRNADETRSAFWDFRGAMGGEASIVRFKNKGMAWSDLIHLTQPGAEYMARRFEYALWREFLAYLAEHPRAGCQAQSVIESAPAASVSAR